MTTITWNLTETASACGVTLEDVARELPRARFDFAEGRAIIAADTSPALAAEVARCGLNVQSVSFSHLALGSMPVYFAA